MAPGYLTAELSPIAAVVFMEPTDFMVEGDFPRMHWQVLIPERSAASIMEG
jgi:hypothetical protein